MAFLTLCVVFVALSMVLLAQPIPFQQAQDLYHHLPEDLGRALRESPPPAIAFFLVATMMYSLYQAIVACQEPLHAVFHRIWFFTASTTSVLLIILYLLGLNMKLEDRHQEVLQKHNETTTMLQSMNQTLVFLNSTMRQQDAPSGTTAPDVEAILLKFTKEVKDHFDQRFTAPGGSSWGASTTNDLAANPSAQGQSGGVQAPACKSVTQDEVASSASSASG